MKQTQTFAQRFPFYMTAETSARTIEIGRALRAQIQRRRASVRIRADVTDYCAAMKKASAIVRDFGETAGPMWSDFDSDMNRKMPGVTAPLAPVVIPFPGVKS